MIYTVTLPGNVFKTQWFVHCVDLATHKYAIKALKISKLRSVRNVTRVEVEPGDKLQPRRITPVTELEVALLRANREGQNLKFEVYCQKSGEKRIRRCFQDRRAFHFRTDATCSTCFESNDDVAQVA